MSPSYFPLRWESTGEQWWYASPIDCAAANGHYDLVRELLSIDTNLLIKLTSLRRIRRLETVWDGHDQFNDVAKCRAYVAKNLLLECETQAGHNSLIRAGYGGWLLYTAASAGDVGFVQDLLHRDPLLVFGEGEYGITDILYAAARSKSSEVFNLLMNFAIGLKSIDGGEGEEGGEFCDGYKWEIMNRAVHCAATGGNLEVLKELLVGCCDVLAYRDAQGSTILHSAAGRGQVKVVEDLVASYNIIDSTDHQGNTALHIAAYRGFLPVVKTLIATSPSMASSTNIEGNTFLHMAVAGFQTPGFHRIDQQLELVKQLVGGKITNIQEIINSRNNHGRTAFHLAVSENIQPDVVELLMTVPSIDLTPMDLLKQHPESESSKLLIKHMASAGGTVSYREDETARAALAAHLKLQGCVGSSPGVSFRVPDSEIFVYAGNEYGNSIANNSEASCSDADSAGFSACSDEDVSQCHSCALSGIISSSGGPKRSRNPMNSALKVLLQWPKRKDKGTRDPTQCLDQTPTSLRQRFSGNCSLPNNKRAIPINGNSPSSPFLRSSISSPASVDKTKGVGRRDYTIRSPCSSELSFNANGGKSNPFKRSQSLFNKKLMNHYFCFGAQGLAVEDSISCRRPEHFQRNLSSNGLLV